MLEAQFRYMPSQPATPMRGCRHRATWSKAWSTLKDELRRIDATNVVVEAGYSQPQIRNDGWPRSDARPEHGDVRITFATKGSTLTFTSAAWEDVANNVYMIALTLKALRDITRFGCVRGNQQYTGWAKLPPGGGAAPVAAAEWASVEAAMRFLCSVGNGEILSILPKDLAVVYRYAARKAHPDAGGSNELMAKVNRARDFIEKGGQ